MSWFKNVEARVWNLKNRHFRGSKIENRARNRNIDGITRGR